MNKGINIAAMLCVACSVGYSMVADNASADDYDGGASNQVESPGIQIGIQEISDLGCSIVFELDNDLWAIDGDTIASNLTYSGDVFSFTCDNNVPGQIYFSVLDEELDLNVYALSLGSSEPDYIGSVENETGEMSYFVTETYGERAQMEVEGNELSIECDFIWDWYDFSDNAFIDLVPVRGEVELNQIDMAPEDDFQITNKIIGDNCELVYTDADGTYQLTHTNGISRWDTYYLEEPLMFRVSPSGHKVLFTVMTDFGDLAHGPMLIVNIDGSCQHQLHFDMRFRNFDYEWVGDYLLYIGYSVKDELFGLFLAAGDDNIPELVVENVTHFEVIL